MTPPDARARLHQRLKLHLTDARYRLGYQSSSTTSVQFTLEELALLADLLAPPVVPAQANREREAFEAGFQWAICGTDKHGEYNGGSVDDGFTDWLQSAPPVAPMPRRRHEGDEEETDTRQSSASEAPSMGISAIPTGGCQNDSKS